MGKTYVGQPDNVDTIQVTLKTRVMFYSIYSGRQNLSNLVEDMTEKNVLNNNYIEH